MAIVKFRLCCLVPKSLLIGAVAGCCEQCPTLGIYNVARADWSSKRATLPGVPISRTMASSFVEFE